MGDLVLMTRPNQSIRREPPAGGSAGILFFTGVRYARVPEADIAPQILTPPRRATKPRRGPRKATDAKRA